METEMLARSAVRKVGCPACGAEAQARCRGIRGREREANHRERVDAAVADRSARADAERRAKPKRFTRED